MRKQNKYIFFFFMLLAIHLPQQCFSKRSLITDELKNQLPLQKNPTKKIELLLKIGKQYGEPQPDSCLHYYQLALNLAKENRLPLSISDVLHTIGMYHHRRGDFVTSKVYFVEHMQLAHQENNPTIDANAYMDMANHFKRTAVPDSAFYYYIKVEEAYRELNDQFQLWKPYTFLGQLYTDSKSYDKAGEYYEKAYEIVKDSDKRLPLGYVLYHLGSHYFMTGQFQKYEPIAERWIEFKNSSKFLNTDPGHQALLLFADVENNESEKLLRSAIEFELKQNNSYMAGLHYLDLGFILKEKENYADALMAYEFAAEQMYNSKGGFQLSQAYYASYDICKKTNQNNEALFFLEKYKTLQDSIQQDKITKNLSELEVQYETEKKDLEIRQKTMQRNILFGSSALLGILAFIIFFLLRNRIKTNKTLADQDNQLQLQKIKQLEQEKKLLVFNGMIEGQENERKRIAKDLHDSIGGLLSSIKSYGTAVGESHPDLKNHPNYLKTINLIDDAVDETRRISHNMMPRALALSGLKSAVEDIAESLRRSGFNCDLEIIGLNKDLDQHKSTMIFRMLQELTHNISKHSKAKNILIQLIQNEKSIDLLVEDDGLGFDSNSLTNKGMGLTNIQSRVEFLQGNLTIDPVANEGTTISISIPV